MTTDSVTILGGGLAGCEAAYQLASRGIPVTIREMRPSPLAPAHHGAHLAELVCSNSFKSTDPTTAAGMLKSELHGLGSLILACARATAIPGGAALAVDRERFAELVTSAIDHAPCIDVVRGEATAIPAEGDVIVATGPLTSDALARSLARLTGSGALAFYDAAAPVIDATTIDESICFAASRYDKGEDAAYLNCPLDRHAYDAFVDALVEADRVQAKDFEDGDLFQACQPVEEVARRGRDALRFGALKPVGLVDPATGRRPWAVVQLRAESRERTAYSLVGFQTNLTFPDQTRVVRLIPGLAGADILRFGVMHRNTFVDAPRLLTGDLALRTKRRVRVAGQLSGTEGYLEAAAGGLVSALGLAAASAGGGDLTLPRETALGALLAYATDPETLPYQPMHVNFGLMPPLEPLVRAKADRHAAYEQRAAAALRAFERAHPELGLPDARARVARAVEEASRS